ncbi:hypothetical protein [Bradyrhizobium liaoningense]|uniref:hypothetical protein n=1 Tax=Bradyrhizobium liaoningense TaxID=43992 RepID=UPI001BAC4FC2|nr:hypothetical protein [Bradyrhizobium liaoningense]MBR0714337.1 hypothetical protein [Bradyrhizobium liaoningense]
MAPWLDVPVLPAPDGFQAVAPPRAGLLAAEVQRCEGLLAVAVQQCAEPRVAAVRRCVEQDVAAVRRRAALGAGPSLAVRRGAPSLAVPPDGPLQVVLPAEPRARPAPAVHLFQVLGRTRQRSLPAQHRPKRPKGKRHAEA